MSQAISAIYEHGVFRPLTPLDLPDHTMVELTLAIPPQISSEPKDIAVDFERELEELSFDGPSLPTTFSREDIYFDHD